MWEEGGGIGGGLWVIPPAEDQTKLCNVALTAAAPTAAIKVHILFNWAAATTTSIHTPQFH